MAMTSPASMEDSETTAREGICYYCQTLLDAEATVCVACGHRQYRVCYCSEHIRPDVATCPHCGADWSESSRVKAKRKSRSHGSVRGLLRSAATGAVGFAAICGVLYLAGGRAAQGLGVEAPGGMLERLWYLGKTIAENAGLLSDRLSNLIGGKRLLQALALLVIGAGLGALWYLVSHSRWLGVKLGLQKTRKHRRAV